jgi:hypothetical protein
MFCILWRGKLIRYANGKIMELESYAVAEMWVMFNPDETRIVILL